MEYVRSFNLSFGFWVTIFKNMNNHNVIEMERSDNFVDVYLSIFLIASSNLKIQDIVS